MIHRPRYDDWSLPKGKVDPGETEPMTAVREVFEETGHHVAPRPPDRDGELSDRATHQESAVLGGTKPRWQFRPEQRSRRPRLAGGARRDEEGVVCLDRKVLRRWAKHPPDTQSVLIVRHGTAGSKSRFSGDDKIRPLDKKGRAQAEALVAQLSAFGPTDVYAADRVRCHQTVEPFAEELGVIIGNEPTLTEEAYADNPKRARRRVLQIAGSHRTPVICTQGKVIPDLIAWWCERDGVRPDKSRNRKGSTWVLSLADGHLIAADHIGSALATNVVPSTQIRRGAARESRPRGESAL